MIFLDYKKTSLVDFYHYRLVGFHTLRHTTVFKHPYKSDFA